jgi:hypothetical protein
MTSSSQALRPGRTNDVLYRLENLYRDQDRDWVVDAVPAVLAWVPGKMKPKAPYRFQVDQVATPGAAATRLNLLLEWSVPALEAHDSGLRQRTKRMRLGRTPQREHVAELAGYGLAMVAISALLPGERVVDMERWSPPDLILDATPGARRGVEVACRSSGGWSVVRGVRLEKAPGLVAQNTLAHAHLSVWSGWPRVSEFCKVKP